MTVSRFRVPEINSLMPSIDARNTDAAFVLDGRNFNWDSKGPKSGFANRLLTPFAISGRNDVQGKRIQDRTFVFTQDAIMNWRTSLPITWDVLYTFDTPVPDTKRTPWQGIYLNGVFYVAQQYRGFFQAVADSGTSRVWFHRKTNLDIPGLIDGILGMDVIRGRAVLVNKDFIQWSGLDDLTDLSPALGGPGIQKINNFVKGAFLSLTSFQDGFVVWTTEGAVLVEYIGGDAVWRFSAYKSQERPYSVWSTIGLINGGSVFLSRRGLKITDATDAPKDWTPDFNEFLRGYLDDKAENLRKWRLEYDQSTETIYLSESTNLNTYWRTFVLSPTLNKWGIFSDTTYGFLPLSEEHFGYVSATGETRFFDPALINRETAPDNALGLSRIYPRFEKQQPVPSSSAVSRAIVYTGISPSVALDVASPGWYPPTQMDAIQPNGLMGLDSWIEIGYLRPAEMNLGADANVEFQELVLGSFISGAPAEQDFTTEWKADWFYSDIEDLSSSAIITHGNLLEDWNTGPDTLIDWLASVDPNEDWQNMDFPTITWADETTEDLMLDPDGTEDLMYFDGIQLGITLGLPEITYSIHMLSSLDGITVAQFDPQVVKFDTGARTFSVSTTGNLHRLRLEAADVWQAYHVRALEASITFNGRLQ